MKPRLLIVSERLWPEGGGAELATHLVIEVLKDYFEVIVVTGTPKPMLHYGVKYVYTTLLQVRNKQKLWLNNILLAQCDWFKNLVEKADIVYIPRYSFPIIWFAKKLKKKVIVHVHDYIPISYTAVILAPAEEHLKTISYDNLSIELTKGLPHGIGSLALQWMPKLARTWLQIADKIICVSKRHYEVVVKGAPELATKLTIAYNPIPKVDYQPPTNLDVGYFGGANPLKGYHILLKAWIKIHRKYRSAKLHATMMGHLNSRIRRVLRKIGVITYGRLLPSELENLWRGVSIAVVPSIWEEPAPYVVVEALLHGRLLIASRVGGIPEIADGAPGAKFVRPGDVDDLVDALEWALSMDRDEVVGLGLGNREHVLKRFDNEHIARRLIDLFYDVLL